MPSMPPMPEPISTPLDDLILVLARMPVGVVERLCRGAHRVDDEVVDLALFLRLHPIVGD